MCHSLHLDTYGPNAHVRQPLCLIIGTTFEGRQCNAREAFCNNARSCFHHSAKNPSELVLSAGPAFGQASRVSCPVVYDSECEVPSAAGVRRGQGQGQGFGGQGAELP